MARAPIMAAGGIVLRREQPPRVAVVRLRKRDEWVLPKGKLDDGETPRDAAKREVLEETGHKVTVHEFLGTLVHDTGTRSKVVHYWRMEASGDQTQPLMDDVRAVDWLPLEAAVARLSRDHEKTFLETVGPYALAGLIRKAKAKPALEPKVAAEKAQAEKASAEKVQAEKVAAEKPATTKKRRSRVTLPSQVPGPPSEPAEAIPEIACEPAAEILPPLEPPAPAQPDTPAPLQVEAETMQPATPETERAPADLARVEAVAAAIKSLVPGSLAPAAEDARASAEAPSDMPNADAAAELRPDTASAAADEPNGGARRSLAQKMRAWLGRAA